MMQIIAKSTLKAFWEKNPQSGAALVTWYSIVNKARWTGPADVKNMFGSNVDFIADNRVIFDLCGNKYRLVVHVAYGHKRVLVKFIGTHSDYNKIDAGRI